MQEPTIPVSEPARSLRSASLHEVIPSLVARHHQYLYRAMPFLQTLAAKVARSHGDTEPSLVDIATKFDLLVTLLGAHMAEEEIELFPAMLEGRVHDAVPLLVDMRREHAEVVELLREIRIAAAGYRPPGWASNSYRTLMYELRALEADVLEHLDLEDRMLSSRPVR